MSTTQNLQVIDHLTRHQTITPLEALSLYGIFRLGARIWDLRGSGHDITTEIIEVKSRRGGKKRVASYRLVKLAKVAA